MNKLKITLISLTLVLASSIASAYSFSSNAAMQSAYIWRGMDQNDSDASVNVGIDVDFENGFYAGTWAATVDMGNGATLEHDYYAGYTFDIGGIGVDIGVISVQYNGDQDIDFGENYIALSLPMNVGFHYSEGDELGDYSEISWSTDLGPGSLALSYGDMDSSSAATLDGGNNVFAGWTYGMGDFDVEIGFYDFGADAANADDNGFVLTISI
tara:strand:- start:1255 stop:1890 length:636 start_codon:yes stop_codon:yes gene_type:complete